MTMGPPTAKPIKTTLISLPLKHSSLIETDSILTFPNALTTNLEQIIKFFSASPLVPIVHSFQPVYRFPVLRQRW